MRVCRVFLWEGYIHLRMQSLKLIHVALALIPLTAPVARAQFPRSVTDPSAVEAGGKIYAAKCAQCHGEDTRGTTKGPDMIRSVMVLHDRREALQGAELGPYLKSSPQHSFSFSEKEISEISQFLSGSVNKILRSGYDSKPTDLLSGDEKAGEAYFQRGGRLRQMPFRYGRSCRYRESLQHGYAPAEVPVPERRASSQAKDAGNGDAGGRQEL